MSLALLTVLLAVSLAGCNYAVYDYAALVMMFTPEVSGVTTGAPGEEVTRTIRVNGTFNGGRVQYSPPRGAMNVVFSGRQPEAGGPPYIFSPVSSGTIATVRYNLPPLPGGETENQVYDVIIANTTAGDHNIAFLTTTIRSPGAAASQGENSLNAVPNLLQTSRRYTVRQFQADPGVALTTALCQSWLDEMKGGKTFRAVRVPLVNVQGASTVAGVQYLASDPPSWSVLDNSLIPGVERMKIPGEVNLGLTMRVNDLLPRVNGEAWVAYSLPDDPFLVCPSGLNVVAGQWSIVTQFSVTLDQAPQPIKSVTCYQGQTPPAFSPLSVQSNQISSYFNNNLTCLGPEIIELEREPDFEVTHGTAEVVNIPGRVQFRHHINPLSGPIDINITLSSDLALEWKLYNSNNADTRPNLASPISLPLRVNNYKGVWVVADVPPGTPAGPYQIDLAVTPVNNPGQSYTVSDLVWLGPWSAPETSGAPAAPNLVYPPRGWWVQPGEVTFAWQPGSGEVPLRYELKVNEQTVETVSTHQTLTLGPGVYFWSVRAWNDAGPSPWSSEYRMDAGLPKLFFPLIMKEAQ